MSNQPNPFIKKRFFLFLVYSSVILSLSFPFALAAESPLNLKSAMGAQAFEEAGLNKLTAGELERLEYWIQTREAMTSEEAAKTAVAKREKEVSEATKKGFGFLNFWSDDETVPDSLKGPESIEAVIISKFDGWSEKTKFKLDNGQVWMVSSQTKSYYKRLDRPKVSIRKSGIGGHILEVLETGRRVRVKRIK